ncbi:MAG: LTA synthase family protein [Bacteroidetes bacterium]|nr:LTA synthase family protein [Bacteroidota bacterium]
MRKKILHTNSLYALILRLLLLFVIYAIVRVVFYAYNSEEIGTLYLSDIWGVIKGSYIFDSASIFYINIPFIALSLLPYRRRVSIAYQKFLARLFIIINVLGLFLNISDIFYFEFRQGRLTSNDLAYFGEDNALSLGFGFMLDYWWGVLFLIILSILLYKICFKKIVVERNYRITHNNTLYYISQTVFLLLFVFYGVFAIRGHSISAARFPLLMSDAGQYVRPKLSSLIQSNPFSIIRTLGNKVEVVNYMPEEEANSIVPEKKNATNITVDIDSLSKPNIVVLILESFANAHIKSLSDVFPADRESYTPFLDSLIGESYVFDNAYKSGLRSIDALPSILGSIPSFKNNLLRYGESQAKYEALPTILSRMGYSTVFYHGGTRSAMGFVSFATMAGVKKFVSMEDYEEKYGTDDFDGKWGIFDHKFLPYMESEMNHLKEPFLATAFTLSSHQPYKIPKELAGKFKEGTLEIHRSISYSDWALKNFFESASKEKWFDNTLFIITGDHGSGADNPKYLEMPYCNQVPIIFYMPSKKIEGRNHKAVQHIDIMPTVLSLLKYDKPFFAFGENMLDSTSHISPIVHYNNNVYNVITDSIIYLFNEKNIVSAYNYKNDFIDKKDVVGDRENQEKIVKSYLQQYFSSLEKRNFTLQKKK